MITALQLAHAFNVLSILFVIAISLRVRRFYDPPFLKYWLWTHVWEAAMVACDLPHLWGGVGLPIELALIAGLFGSLSLWGLIQLGRSISGPPFPEWMMGPTVGLGVGSVGVLYGMGVAGYNVWALLLLAIQAALFWVGWQFILSSRGASVSNAIWLGVPFCLRATALPLIPMFGSTSSMWICFAVGASLHLITGAGTIFYVMREGSEALRAKYDLLQVTNQLHKDFLHTMSHELRTPLAVMAQGAHAMVALEERARREEVNQLVQERVQELTRTVSGVLDFARLESGSHPLDYITEDLGLYLTGWVSSWKLLAERSGHSLEAQISEASLPLRFDPQLIRQALENLITNAFQHTPAGCVVVVRAWREGDRIRLCVSDNGPGVALEHQGAIFEKFSQVSGIVRGGGGGLGLGLALCREIVQKCHQGRLWLECAPGQGAAFHLALPATLEATLPST